MSWIGAGIGALLGSMKGGVLSSVIGAAIGNYIEEAIKGAVNEQRSNRARSYSTRGYTRADAPRSAHAHGAAHNAANDAREMTVLGAIAAMLSKMAKADGVITPDEVRYCEGVFDQLGLRGEKRTYCIHVFQAAKNDAHTIYDYAESFASLRSDRCVREIAYGVLWDLANVDGVVSPEELEMLRNLPAYLKINASCFTWECSRRGVDPTGRRRSRAGGQRRAGGSAEPEDPYQVLGVSRSASDEAVKKAYRAKAKALHPDTLRAQGLSEELLGKANEQMARVNAAWSEIRKSRGI